MGEEAFAQVGEIAVFVALGGDAFVNLHDVDICQWDILIREGAEHNVAVSDHPDQFLLIQNRYDADIMRLHALRQCRHRGLRRKRFDAFMHGFRHCHVHGSLSRKKPSSW